MNSNRIEFIQECKEKGGIPIKCHNEPKGSKEICGWIWCYQPRDKPKPTVTCPSCGYKVELEENRLDKNADLNGGDYDGKL